VTEPKTVVFSDGAAKGNPGPGGWGAIIAHGDGRVVEIGGRGGETTNNRMELTAALRALEAIEPDRACAVYTDSTYLIKGITSWLAGWKKKSWKTSAGAPVLNKDLWQRLDEVCVARSGTIAWRHVRGHAGVAGNERADEIATAFAEGRWVDLYDGPRSSYGIALDDLSETATRPAKSPKRGGRAYSYLSVLDGRPMKHASWTECERRVKGRPGSRYKKAMSEAEEADILAGWGFSPGDV
jgi:ribonuclease HI